MSDCYTFHEGTLPLLVSVPHDGRQIPDEIARQMTGTGRDMPDTDWHVAQLYDFARDVGAAMIVASYSRYVVDLNRPADDTALYKGQLVTGLCPTHTFAGQAIYVDSSPVDTEDRVARYWRPYHDKIATTLAVLRERHGYALLWDAHSIASRVPRLFDGELAILNLGTWENRSCDVGISTVVMAAAEKSPCDAVLNGRFKGGHITRHYGEPNNGVHAIQLELAQRAYMNEATLEFDDDAASQLRGTLRTLLEAYLSAGARIRR